MARQKLINPHGAADATKAKLNAIDFENGEIAVKNGTQTTSALFVKAGTAEPAKFITEAAINIKFAGKSNTGHTHNSIVNGNYGAQITSDGYIVPIGTNPYIGKSDKPWAAIYGTTIYEGGKALSDKYQAKGTYLTSHQHAYSHLNGDSGSASAEKSEDYLNIKGGTAIGTVATDVNDVDTLTINHDNITRSKETTGTTTTLSFGSTFNALGGVASNAQGHVTGSSVVSYKLPANPNTDYRCTEAGHYNPTGKTAVDTSTQKNQGNEVTVITSLSKDSNGHITNATGAKFTIPTIPSTRPNPYSLTIKKNNGLVATYNGSSAVTANITVPTKVSDLDNDSKFITSGTTVSYANSAGSVNEANLNWGGRNHIASFGCIDAAMIPELGANRLEFAKAEGVVIEYSNDGGSTWKDYGASNATKLALTSSGTGLRIGKYSSSPSTSKDKLRITFKTGEAGIYTALNKFAIYISTEGGQNCTCTIQKAIQSKPDNYVTVVNKQSIGGWSGWNVINVPSITTYGNSPDSQYGRIRFIFESTGGGATYKGLVVYKIMGFGGQGWTTPSTMAKTGHLYSYNENKRASFPEYVSSSGFIKSGYDDSYVLKAGGGPNLKVVYQ